MTKKIDEQQEADGPSDYQIEMAALSRAVLERVKEFYGPTPSEIDRGVVNILTTHAVSVLNAEYGETAFKDLNAEHRQFMANIVCGIGDFAAEVLLEGQPNHRYPGFEMSDEPDFSDANMQAFEAMNKAMQHCNGVVTWMATWLAMLNSQALISIAVAQNAHEHGQPGRAFTESDKALALVLVDKIATNTKAFINQAKPENVIATHDINQKSKRHVH